MGFVSSRVNTAAKTVIYISICGEKRPHAAPIATVLTEYV